jgi:hypothetical protein
MPPSILVIAACDIEYERIFRRFDAERFRFALYSSGCDAQIGTHDLAKYVDLHQFSGSDRDDLIEDYADEYSNHLDIVSVLSSSSFYGITYGGFGLVCQLLRVILAEMGGHAETSWLDTMYGWVVRCDRLRALLDRDPRWDWRRTSDLKVLR